MFYKFLQIFLTPFVRKLWVDKVDGLENIPAKQGCILACNHQSKLDALIIGSVLKRRIYYLVAEKFYDSIVLNWFFRLTRQIRVDRSKGVRNTQAIAKGSQLLKQGKVLCIFPEGRLSANKKIGKYYTGIARFALLARVPVIPVAISDSFDICSRFDRRPKFNKKCSIKIGRPMFFEDHDGSKVSASILQEITDKVMGRIEQLLLGEESVKDNKPKKIDFAFLFHPRAAADFYKKYPSLRFVPQAVLKLVAPYLKPRIAGRIKVKINQQVKQGVFIGLPQFPGWLLSHPEKALKKVKQAVGLAEELGAKIVGLGSLTSPISHGGLDLQEQFKIGITNGNALTAAVAIDGVRGASSHPQLTLAIVGATGSIGSACSRALAHQFKKTILIARKLDKLRKLQKEITRATDNSTLPAVAIAKAGQIQDVQSADIILLATSHHKVLIKPEHLKENAVIYDITQPSNLDKKEFAKNRPDVKIITGGLVKIPNLKMSLDIGLPQDTVFACLAETILLSLENYNKDFSVGYVDREKIEEIVEMRRKRGI